MERRGGKAIRRWGTAVIASAAAVAVAAPATAAQAA
ncbi:D-alanyl-D-alanine carboxypeptidase (penicillin-binding protein 5/6), partial [Streptomyces sp. MnatMP-M27]